MIDQLKKDEYEKTTLSDLPIGHTGYVDLQDDDWANVPEKKFGTLDDGRQFIVTETISFVSHQRGWIIGNTPLVIWERYSNQDHPILVEMPMAIDLVLNTKNEVDRIKAFLKNKTMTKVRDHPDFTKDGLVVFDNPLDAGRGFMDVRNNDHVDDQVFMGGDQFEAEARNFLSRITKHFA